MVAATEETVEQIEPEAKPAKHWWGADGRLAEFSKQPSLLYPSNRQCERVLQSAGKTLGVTRYRMSYLLGVRECHYRRYFNGSRRPSALMFSRINILLVLKASGVLIQFVESVDWVLDEIVYGSGARLGEPREGDSRWRDPISKFIPS